MTVVIVKVGKQKDLKGTFAGKEFWPEGVTKKDISEHQITMLQRTRAKLTVVAIGDEQVEAYEEAEKRIAAHRAKGPKPHVPKSTPNPGEPGSPSKPLKPPEKAKGTDPDAAAGDDKKPKS